MDVHAFYRSLSPSGVESIDLLARDIADEAAVTDIECFAARRRIEPVDGGSWLYDVTTQREAFGPNDDPEGDLRIAQRATRYLILRGRIALVEQGGQTLVRILHADADATASGSVTP